VIDNKKDVLKNQIFTIPNILSLLRIVMIPVIVWLYKNDRPQLAVLVLILSGLTDIVDGFIARHFNLISNLGKILDPIADKLTQAVILLSVSSEYPLMLIPLILLTVKEVSLSIIGIFVISKTKEVKGANWHGKVTTFMLYFTLIIHIICVDLSPVVSDMTIGACVTLMMLSFVLYVIRNIRQLDESKVQEK
jgi:cardiolipin synthase